MLGLCMSPFPHNWFSCLHTYLFQCSTFKFKKPSALKNRLSPIGLPAHFQVSTYLPLQYLSLTSYLSPVPNSTHNWAHLWLWQAIFGFASISTEDMFQGSWEPIQNNFLLFSPGLRELHGVFRSVIFSYCFTLDLTGVPVFLASIHPLQGTWASYPHCPGQNQGHHYCQPHCERVFCIQIQAGRWWSSECMDSWLSQ